MTCRWAHGPPTCKIVIQQLIQPHKTNRGYTIDVTNRKMDFDIIYGLGLRGRPFRKHGPTFPITN